MKENFKYIVIFIFIFSCKKEVNIDSKLRTQVLIEAINDTLEYNLLHYENPFIHQLHFNSDEKRVTIKNNKLNNISLTNFVSHHLNEKDTLYVFNQLDSMSTYDMSKIKEYGYNYIDWRLLKKYTFTEDSLKIDYLIPKDSIKTLEKAIEFNNEIWLSKPILNKKIDKAYFEVHYSGNHYNGIVYNKIKDNWRFYNIAFSTE